MNRRDLLTTAGAALAASTLPAEAVEFGSYEPTVTATSEFGEVTSQGYAVGTYEKRGDMVIVNITRIGGVREGGTVRIDLPTLTIGA
jgi:hypothetical protein